MSSIASGGAAASRTSLGSRALRVGATGAGYAGRWAKAGAQNAKYYAQTYPKTTGVVVGVPLAIAATPYVLVAAGFTATGVAAGSAATGIQSVVYGAYTMGLFSAVQSAGVLGVGALGTVVAASTGAVAGVAGGRLAEKMTA